MNAAPEISPILEADARWSAAAERVTCYLRAHGLASPGQVARLTADIVAIARTRLRPGAEPMTLAMETVDSCLKAWFAQLLPAGADEAQLHARGRVALAMGGVPARWPGSFMMSSHPLPEELVRVMREADLGRAPEIKFSNMAPRVIVPPAAPSWLKWQLSYRWPFVRIVANLMVVLSLLGATYAAGR